MTNFSFLSLSEAMLASYLKTHKIKMVYFSELDIVPQECLSRAVEEGHFWLVWASMDALGYDRIHDDLFRYYHKRKFSRRIHDDLLPVAWHPDQFFLISVLMKKRSSFLRGCGELANLEFCCVRWGEKV